MSDGEQTKDRAGNTGASPGLMPEAKLQPCQPDISNMTEAQFDAELAKGFEDLKAGRTVPAGQAFEELRREFGI
jgi:DNA-damage-inducible protein J